MNATSKLERTFLSCAIHWNNPRARARLSSSLAWASSSSGNSLHETGIFANWAGDFWQLGRSEPKNGSQRRKPDSAKAAIGGHSRFLRETRRNVGLPG